MGYLKPQLAWAIFIVSTLIQPTTAGPPNLVTIFIDDMGYADPSCFGNPKIETPNIDRLAKEGIRLTNFYVNSPICSASRVALTTGRYQQRYRIHSFFATRKRNAERKMPNWLAPTAPTLAKLLKKKNYHTAHFGKWHMGGGRDVHDAPLPQAYGFDESLVSFEGCGDRLLWVNEKNPSWNYDRGTPTKVEKHETTGRYIDRAIDFIRRHKDERFYVRVFPNDVHDAHVPNESQLKKWKHASDDIFEQKFLAVLNDLDNQIGRLIDTIDALGLGEETLILFTSDNGPTDWAKYYKNGGHPPGFTGPFFGRKWSLFEGGIRMPFIARWKGTIPSGATNYQSVMCAIDVLPTVATFVGQEPSEQHDGHDMSRALLGKDIRRPAPVFWEYGVHGSIKPGTKPHISPNLAMREGIWKLLCNPDGSDVHLFNLAEDAGETNNLAAKQSDRAKAMKTSLLNWWTKMNGHYANL